MHMVKALALGQDIATVVRWSGRFAAGSVSFWRVVPSRSPTPPTSLGLPFDVWTSARRFCCSGVGR